MNEIIYNTKKWIINYTNQHKNNIKQKNKKNKIRQSKKDMIPSLLLYGDDDIQKINILNNVIKSLNNDKNNKEKYEIINITQESLIYLKKQKKEKDIEQDTYYLNFIYKFFNQILLNDKQHTIKIMVINENLIYNFNEYKDVIINLITYNNNNYPIIMILNSVHSKLLNLLKKKTENYLIPNHSFTELKNFIINKLKNNNIINNTNNELFDLIISLSNYNIHKINTLLYDLINTYSSNNKINIEDLNNFKENTLMNNNKEIITKSNYDLLTKFNGLNKSYELFNHDKINNPLVMEEQYINKIIQYENDYKNDKDKMIYLNNITNNISKSFVYSNLYDTYIFNYQRWDFIKIYGFFSCILPSYYLSLLETKYSFNPFITYPIDMNKSSIQKMNTKQINIIYENINLIDINYLIYLNELIYYLIKKSSNNTTNINRIKLTNFTKNFIKYYNLNMSLIDKILKINKLSLNEIKLSKKLHSYLFI